MKFIESLFLGIIAALGALFMEIAINALVIGENLSLLQPTHPSLEGIGLMFLFPIIIEEFFKFIIIKKRLEYFSLGRALIINSMILGIGFGLVEISLIYLWGQSDPKVSRSIIEIVVLHTLTAGMIGYLFSQLNPKKITTGIKVILASSLIHLAYNVLVFYRNDILNLVILGLLSILTIFLTVNIILFDRKLAQ
jgi:hypothetical protein